MAKADDIHGLKILGSGPLAQPQAPPSTAMLEAFPNRFEGRLYLICIEFPEFTSLCPVTGQPDFGTIRVEYIPAASCVESKSFKLYMFSWRNQHGFMETITNNILDDLVTLLNPCWCRVQGLFVPRGGTRISVFAEHYKQDMAPDLLGSVRQAVQEWLVQTTGYPVR